MPLFLFYPPSFIVSPTHGDNSIPPRQGYQRTRNTDSQVLKGNRKITADTALRLAKYFGNSADFWLGIQDEYDLRRERIKIAGELEKIPHVVAS
jgi:plasmid maintenance system antidote protein VapI